MCSGTDRRDIEGVNISCFIALMVSKWAHQTNDRRVSTRVSGGSRTMKTSRWRKGDGEKSIRMFAQ